MDSQTWERVKELFEAALALPEEEQDAFIKANCQDNDLLRLELESLLAAHRKAAGFMRSAKLNEPPTSSLFPPALSAGQIISHRYQVVRFIGRGGMGEVYEAKDRELRTRVALKTIRPELSRVPGAEERFRQEVKLALRVTHPNVCRMYHIEWQPPPEGSTEPALAFITMELLEGETLASRIGREGPMSIALALSLIRQMAAGLAEAHEVGVVHCDFKPSNVMLVSGHPIDVDTRQETGAPAAAARQPGTTTATPRAVITDFGLARAIARPSAPTLSSTGPLGHDAHYRGTPPYMAPEQLAGSCPTQTSDIYALGLVMYEMVTGHQPLPGDPLRRLYESPPPPRSHVPDLDERWERTILRCLDRAPASRPATAPDVVAALCETKPSGLRTMWKVGIAVALIVALSAVLVARNLGGLRDWVFGAEIKSLAVLPLDNLSGDPKQDYFADGMTDELITDLAKISALRVISRTSVMQYKGTKETLAEIARALHVDVVVTGSVLRSGNQVRIAAQLIDPHTDSSLWAESYERDVHDILELQSDVARAIAGEIRIKMTSQEQQQLAVSRPVDSEAYEAYLKGREYWEERTEDGVDKAIDYFQAAIDKDPSYARAYAGFADCYNVLGSNRFRPPVEAFPKAEAAARKALRIDDNLGEAHASLAFALWNYDFDWQAVEKEYKRAIELNPNYATSYHWYAGYLAGMGRSKEAIDAINKAHELDPLSSRINANIGLILYLAREYDQAVEILRRASETNPNDEASYGYLGMVYLQKANYPAAIANFEKSYALLAGSGGSALDLAYGYAIEGKQDQARSILDHATANSQQKYESSLWVARVYLALGENDQAMAWLQRAYTERSTDLPFLKVDPRLDGLRADPKFQALLRLMKL